MTIVFWLSLATFVSVFVTVLVSMGLTNAKKADKLSAIESRLAGINALRNSIKYLETAGTFNNDDYAQARSLLEYMLYQVAYEN